MRGTFIAVVGPSGAGKDTLISAALAGRSGIVRARRTISRPPAPGTEDFHSVTPARFDALEAMGGFALSWRAHGIGYGIPLAVERVLEMGRHVIANLSRRVIDAARARLAPVRVIVVTAPDHVLARRLAARGRETADDIAGRLARADDPMPEGGDIRFVVNDGRLETALADFLDALPQPVSGWRSSRRK